MEPREKQKAIAIGFRVGKLTVEKPTDQRKSGYMVWYCRCDCGGSVRLDTRTLQRGAVKNCGCEKLRPHYRDISGMRFGKLVALEPVGKTGGNESVIWRCRCDCGGEVEAPLKQLQSGYRKSCGCLSHPPLKAFEGRRFGFLTVLSYAGKDRGMHRWRCLCDCGKETVVGQSLLQRGKTKSCGCNGKPPPEDITGKKFGKLTVQAEAERRNGAAYWHCRCECGRETVVRYHYLITGHTKSCGCLQRSAFKENLKLVEGTSVAMLEAGKNRKIATNTSGYTGVYRNVKTDKWIAQITFKKRTYYLGSYETLEEAASARRTGEEMHDMFLQWYYSEHPNKSPDYIIPT